MTYWLLIVELVVKMGAKYMQVTMLKSILVSSANNVNSSSFELTGRTLMKIMKKRGGLVWSLAVRLKFVLKHRI